MNTGRIDRVAINRNKCEYNLLLSLIFLWGLLVCFLHKKGETPLHVAADSWVPHRAVTVLLDAKAAIDAKDNNGRTPLHLAAAKGRTAVARALVDAKAAVDLPDDWGKTPLHHAVEHDHNETVRVLLSSSANLRTGGTKKKARRRHR